MKVVFSATFFSTAFFSAPLKLQAESSDAFPFLSAAISADFPEGNISNKGIAIRLDHGAAVLFDTDLLRMAAGWTGDFLNLTGVTFDGNHGGHPSINGVQQFGVGTVPGWIGKNSVFQDPRTEPYGPIAETQGRWEGLHLVDRGVVLSYTVRGARIMERPSAVAADGKVGFVRTFKTESPSEELVMIVSEVAGARGRIEEGLALLESPLGTVTAVGLEAAPEGVSLAILDGTRIVLKLEENAVAGVFNVVIWNGDPGDLGDFASLLQGEPEWLDLNEGGPRRWSEEVVTQGVIGADSDGAYTVDRLTPPENNPWNRRVRFGGFDFFSDGKRAALSTWDGDIWLVSGIDDTLEELTWTRFASGLFETLGLKIVDDVIYTAGRDQITRFHDLNGNGEADFYENFNNRITSSPGFHEFVFDLQTDADGNFYFAKGGPVRGGGRGYGGGGSNGEISAHAGTIMQVSADGRDFDVYATGFRAPNGIGVSPSGQVTSGDNEGTWIPASPINWVKRNGFYGVEDLSHRQRTPEFNPPLAWLAHRDFCNSNGGQVWAVGDEWGPLKDRMLYLSYGKSALYLVMKQDVDGLMQGGVVQIPARFTSSAMRGRFNPLDGQLYVAGLRGWQTNAANLTGLDRVRYTGEDFYSVVGLTVDTDGIHLTFSRPLDEEDAVDLQNYSMQRWNYDRGSHYGSPEYSVANPEEVGRDPVTLRGARLSADGKTVTLEVEDLKPVMQNLIRFSLLSEDGEIVEQQVLHTIHRIPGS